MEVPDEFHDTSEFRAELLELRFVSIKLIENVDNVLLQCRCSFEA